MVRLHYGHPDVWDGVWAVTSGRRLQGFKDDSCLRGYFRWRECCSTRRQRRLCRFVHCGKAGDITFAGTNQFEQKISGGNALQCMSRDYARLGASLDIFRLLSLYTTSIGYFLTASLLHTALVAMLVSLISLALCGAETYFDAGTVSFEAERGSVGYSHVYSAEFVLQLGFVKALPLFVELWLEHSFFAALYGLMVDIFTLKQVFTLFTERTRDYFFDQGVLYGTASYIATGRSFASSPPTLCTSIIYTHAPLVLCGQDRRVSSTLRSCHRHTRVLWDGDMGLMAPCRLRDARAVDIQPSILQADRFRSTFTSFLCGLMRIRV